jgi:hypothetical protein
MSNCSASDKPENDKEITGLSSMNFLVKGANRQRNKRGMLAGIINFLIYGL